jgi:hypothetical protein
MGSFVTARDADINRLARLSGLGSLPYRSFHNAPVRRAPAPPAPPPEAARPSATVLALSPAAGDGAPVLRVITGMGGGMGGLSARPLPVMRPAAELAPMPSFADRPAAIARPAAPAPGFGLLSRAIGEEVLPLPPASPAHPPAAQAGRDSFPLLNAALSAGGGSPWR